MKNKNNMKKITLVKLLTLKKYRSMKETELSDIIREGLMFNEYELIKGYHPDDKARTIKYYFYTLK